MDWETMHQHLSEEQIARYRKRQLTPAELPEIDDHISHCADCRDRLAPAADLQMALQRERVARSDSDPPGIAWRGEHLGYEELEAYVDKRSSLAERDVVRKHVEICRSCAEELQDLDAYKTELAGSRGARAWNLRAPWAAFIPAWATPSRAALTLAVSAAILLGVSLARMRLSAPHSEPSGRTTKPAPTIGSPNGAETLIAGSDADIHAINTMLPEQKRAVLEAIKQQKFNFPNVLAELHGQRQTLLGESQSVSGFEVLSPLGEVVLDVRPLFRWELVTGAASYSVSIFDASLNPVQSSGTLHVTEWTPDYPLKRGQLYEWQVTAKLGGGKSVSAPNPPSPEAKFRVLDQKKTDEIAHFQEANPEAHIALGIMYVQAGLLEPGEHELEQLPKTDPNYGLAQNLLKSIREIRHPRH
jgi:hypothetical protein